MLTALTIFVGEYVVVFGSSSKKMGAPCVLFLGALETISSVLFLADVESILGTSIVLFLEELKQSWWSRVCCFCQMLEKYWGPRVSYFWKSLKQS